MNPRNKISRYVIIAVVCAAIWMLNFSVSVNSVVGGIFDLKRGIEIGKIVVIENGHILIADKISSSGSNLEVQFTNKEIDVPWTLYIPFFQFGRASCRLLYRVQVEDKYWAETNISIEEETKRYAFWPKFSRRSDLNDQLTIEVLKSAKVSILKSKT